MPYREESHGQIKYRITIRTQSTTGGTSKGESRLFDDEEEARAYRAVAEVEIARRQGITVAAAIEQYEQYLQTKGNRAKSRAETIRRLRSFCSPLDRPLARLTPEWGAMRYAELLQQLSVDSHRNYLAEAKTFLGWCASAPRRWLKGNPLAEVKGEGKRNHGGLGRAKLRINEARRWEATGQRLAEQGDAGAILALAAYYLPVRASDLTRRVVRDLDDNGRVLWIEEGTKDSSRPVPVPAELGRHLLALAEGRIALAPRWPTQAKRPDKRGAASSPDRVNDEVKRICRLAGVPEVNAHSLRGLRADLDRLAGAGGLDEVSERFAHRDIATTRRSYLDKGTDEQAQAARAMRVLKGDAA